jgi:hypothetical protein
MNERYLQSYTSTFGLEPSFYAGKRILDIGLRPARQPGKGGHAERVGLEPLVSMYLKMGADPGTFLNHLRMRSAH